MKKVTALVLSAVMGLSLAGCGNSSGQAEPAGSANGGGASDGTNIVSTEAGAAGGGAHLIFSWWGNQTRNERTQAALDLYAEQNPGVTFDSQFSDWGDYWNRLATASAGHNLPDLIQMDYKYIKQYAENNMLVDLNPYVEAGLLDVSNVDPGILESGTINGKLYAICAGVNAPALIYNKTLLDELGITVEDNMTMDEFYAVCREVYEKSGVKTNISYGLGENYIDYTLRSQGVELYSADGTSFGVESYEDFVPYFQIYENGLAEGWMVRPEVFAERSIGTVEQDPLVYGATPDARSWCYFTYSNALSATQAAAAADEIEVGITTWPATNPSAANHLRPGMFFSLTVDSTNPEEAVKVLDFLTNSVECNLILLAERGLPASSVVTDGIASELDELQQMAAAYVEEVVTPNSSPISPAAPERSTEVLDMLDQLQEQVCYSQMTAEEAAQQLFTNGNAILGN